MTKGHFLNDRVALNYTELGDQKEENLGNKTAIIMKLADKYLNIFFALKTESFMTQLLSYQDFFKVNVKIIFVTYYTMCFL